MEERASIIRLLGLPESFTVVLLIFSFILVLAPYFAGGDFGLFKIPQFTDNSRKKLRIIGPIVLLVLISLFVPIIPQHGAANLNNANRSDNDNTNARIEKAANPPPVDVRAQVQQHIKRANDLYTHADNDADFAEAVKECNEALALEPENQEALNLKERINKTWEVLKRN